MTSPNGVLHAFERNRFYYGKLMDVRHWTTEQNYGIEVRRMLGRLALGSGVLCGLETVLTAEGAVWISPGVAIDGSGREIVVGDGFCVRHPEQPTDCLGRPDGEAVTVGEVTIELCYHECLTEPGKAIACGCDTVERCEPGMVQERFCVRVTPGVPARRAPFPCDAIFPAPPPEGFDRRLAAFDALSGACPPASGDCVALATVAYAIDKPPVIDPFTSRRVIYSNQTLFELIICLAARVDRCCGEHPQPVDHPPRVMGMWPRDRQIMSELPDERDSFVKLPRLEVAFERSMAAAAIADPDRWLRMWSFREAGDGIMVRRVELTHADPPPIEPVIVTGPGEQLGVYVCDERYRSEMREGRALVQLRPADGGAPVVLDTGSPAQLLDGEHHGTLLTQAQLDELWRNVTDVVQSVTADPGVWPALLGPGAPFPTGDAAEGGALDLGFAFTVPVDDRQTRLRAVWPPSASALRRDTPNPDEREWHRMFRAEPRLELRFDDTLDLGALGSLDVDDWLRTWWVRSDGDVSRTERIRLHFAGETGSPVLPGPAGSVTVVVAMEDVPFADFNPGLRHHFVTVLRGDVASVDADFEGLKLVASEVHALWVNNTWSGGEPSGPSSVGVQMFDGDPGGTAVTFFRFADDA